VATPAPAASFAPPRFRVAIARVDGAVPDPIANHLIAKLSDAARMHRIALVKEPIDRADYTLRGYLGATRAKVSYHWEVKDRNYSPIGDEPVDIPDDDPSTSWAAVTPKIVEAIASKTAASLGNWLQNRAPAAVARSQQATEIRAQTMNPMLASTPATTTAKKERTDAVNAVVISITGARGDGGVSLAGALRRELSRDGITLADKVSSTTYRVEGTVMMGEGRDGMQRILIDWRVEDPHGKRVGTVFRRTEVPQGSLDGSWGKTADAAAAAAAQGILKLLPKSTRAR
jgi:hypothetical protein